MKLKREWTYEDVFPGLASIGAGESAGAVTRERVRHAPPARRQTAAEIEQVFLQALGAMSST